MPHEWKRREEERAARIPPTQGAPGADARSRERIVMSDKRVSEAVIHRLPRYYRELTDLKRRGIERISSSELSDEMGLNASQIRQDFNCFGGFGQQGYGYQVDNLLHEISKILGLTQSWNMVIVGAGNIGSALLRYTGFDKDGYHIIGAFDSDPALHGQRINDVLVHDASALSAFLAENKVHIGVICTQKTNAQQVCDSMVKGGVRGIWNYAPIDVTSDQAFVENVHLNDSLYVLSYRLNSD